MVQATNSTTLSSATQAIQDCGAGVDNLTGGLGADVFKLNTTTESLVGLLHDAILDFSSLDGDKIDLSVIDAQTNIAGNQAFIGLVNTFSNQSGQLMFDSATHSVFGDINGDGIADFQIELLGVNTLSDTDFVL